MLIRSFNLLLFSLFAILFFVIIQEPYELDKLNVKVNFKSLEANDIIGYEIDSKVIKKLKAEQYYKVGNTDNVNNFLVENSDKKLSSNIAIKKDNVIYLKDDVKYFDKDISIFTNEASFFIAENMIISDTKTKVINKNNELEAKSFKYNTKTGDLVLNEVYLCIEK